MTFEGLIFDFDGVLLESEYAGNAQMAAFLTEAGHPTRVEDALRHFTGLAGDAFVAAVERWIDAPLPAGFAEARDAEDQRAMREGLTEVAGAIAFVRSLPADLPRAIASSSSSAWIRAHLDHLGLRDAFEPMIFSGREHVANGKPAPDIYLHAAAAMDVPIERCLIIEDSAVGAKGAVASGATVVGLCAGTHCAPDHADMLRSLGVQQIAHSFDEVATFLISGESRSPAAG
ncbi:HAD family hydrolase [Allosphingosinicella indica]|uniref:Haloacid dehalogenase superfamily, subfamily IA, variant 3 with third motif having DD or ED n=1 Tax=Allosphingosinicella indica TaxID=941907 RepID=A0A1X7G550_9SPHN|nr:HAD family phosphatase [Allosphingosinicella indica]SMF63619.1 haloacid dehalogenase superfamily, subfamily IA, variant 3 with third motif having DD or ED [Allosphingosinicella indica]